VEGTGKFEVAMGVETMGMPWDEAKVEDEGRAVTWSRCEMETVELLVFPAGTEVVLSMGDAGTD
jgi:hypothetical protein